jgi:hypothetical protein
MNGPVCAESAQVPFHVVFCLFCFCRLQRMWFERAATGDAERAHLLSQDEWETAWGHLHEIFGDESAAELLSALFEVQEVCVVRVT